MLYANRETYACSYTTSLQTKRSSFIQSRLLKKVATSTIWAQQQPRQHPHFLQSHIPQRPPPPLTSQQILPPIYSPRLHQLKSLSFHSNSMVVPPSSASAGGNFIRRSSLMNPISVPFSPSTNHHPTFSPASPATTTTSSSGSCSNTP